MANTESTNQYDAAGCQEEILRNNLEYVDDPAFKKIISRLQIKDAKSLRATSRQLRRRVELYCNNVLILTARTAADVLEIADLVDLEGVRLEMGNSRLSSNQLSQLIKHVDNVLLSLSLNKTSFTGIELSGENVKLERLQSLCLADCSSLTQQGIENMLSSMGDNLMGLDLSATGISDLELVNLGVRLDKLEVLDLSDCWDLTDQGLSELLCVTSGALEHLHLFRTNITCEGLTGLDSQLVSLQTLDLNECRILTDQGLNEIVSLTGGDLTELHLAGTDVTTEGLARQAVKLANIQVLKLDGCRQLDNHGFLELLNMTGKNLAVLDMSRTDITCEGLSELDIHLKNLKKLNMDSCKSLTNQRIMEILHTTDGNLKELNLSRTNITGEELLDARMPKLEILKMDGCRNLTDELLVRILNMTCETLRDLDLARTNITGEAFCNLNVKLKKLVRLRLDGCRNLKIDWIRVALENAGENLETLDLSRTLITGEGFNGLNIKLDKLVSLNLSYCRRLTLQGLKEILGIARHLKEIILDGTQLSRSLILDWLKDHNPALAILSSV